ncbi:hypothetical protein TNCV_542981 [Trichonephila clavipes]|nr:hypothetical protein TNCV_542981 [Trichonephila clavipes]
MPKEVELDLSFIHQFIPAFITERNGKKTWTQSGKETLWILTLKMGFLKKKRHIILLGNGHQKAPIGSFREVDGNQHLYPNPKGFANRTEKKSKSLRWNSVSDNASKAFYLREPFAERDRPDTGQTGASAAREKGRGRRFL